MGWRDYSHTKKGFLIGLFIGTLLSIVVLFGIVKCRWNPVDASVVPKGVCSVYAIFFFPISFFYFIIYARVSAFFKWIGIEDYAIAYDRSSLIAYRILGNVGLILSVIISTLVIAGIASFIGWIVEKKASRKNISLSVQNLSSFEHN